MNWLDLSSKFSCHAACLAALAMCCAIAPATASTPVVVASPYAQAYLDHEFRHALQRARRGEVSAQYQVGRSYQSGVGVRQDFVQADRWLRRAAARGTADAVFALGELQEFGMGVPADAAKARHYYTLAAEGRSVRSFHALGRLYRDGAPGVRADNSEAFKWFSLAAAHGHHSAAQDKSRTASGMSLIALEYAGYRANAWERLQQGQEAVLLNRREAPLRKKVAYEPQAYQFVDVYRIVNPNRVQ